jgi:hypothetical protein
MFQSKLCNSSQTLRVYNNPVLPCTRVITGGLNYDKEIQIIGLVLEHWKRFEVNLINIDDIALHFNPRFEENCIVFNTQRNERWGNEERLDWSAFSTSKYFQLNIRVENSCYSISINGQHVYNYKHRV